MHNEEVDSTVISLFMPHDAIGAVSKLLLIANVLTTVRLRRATQ
jgi:hypothetical protein